MKVAFETLGCRSNYADTIDLQAALVAAGATPCEFEPDADVFVINTCTVTDNADKTALRLVRKAKSLSPNARIVVTGCMAEVSPETFSQVDAVIGPGRRDEVLAKILQTSTVTQKEDVLLPGPGKPIGDLNMRARYHLRVQDGCEQKCTYCIIPQSRGEFRTRPITELLAEIEQLDSVGYQEVVVTGTHLGGYGEDTGSSLFELLEALGEKSKIRRIRLSSIDPNDVTPDILRLISENPVFCRHLHICIQSFSDKILKRMNRLYRLADVTKLVHNITELMPNCCIGSDVIVGFPGEGREDVTEELEIFLKLPFSYLHVFPYSERKNTAATRLDGEVPVVERNRRSARWRSLSDKRKKEFYKKFITKELEIVVESIHEDVVHGTSREFVSSKVFLKDDHRPELGSILRVHGNAFDSIDGRLICQ